MRKFKLNGLSVIRETIIKTSLGSFDSGGRKPFPTIEVVIDGMRRMVKLTYLVMFSRPSGMGQIVLEFMGENDGMWYSPGSVQLTRALRNRMKTLRSLSDLKRIGKPNGHVSHKWMFLRPRNTLGHVGISDFRFRLEIDFKVNRASRETFLEASLRILGHYLDAFGIDRKSVRPDSFQVNSYVMTKPKSGTKQEKVLVTDFVLGQNGF